MAKSAKSVELDVSAKTINTFVKDMLEHYDNIESERGKFMLAARREREGMTALYEAMAARGIPQKASKTEIKIVRALQRIKGWMADLEEEERAMVAKMAGAQDDTAQMQLFDLPKVPKPRKRKAKSNGSNVVDIGVGGAA